MAHPHRLFLVSPGNRQTFRATSPIVAEFPILQAGAIGLKAASHAGVFIVPGPACYMGGNIVAGVLYPGVHLSETLNLFIDVGTNGEIVLGDQTFSDDGRLFCGACL